jgi:hypothetical protein
MTQKFLWRGVLIAILSVALATPARANKLETAAEKVAIGIVVVGALVATILFLHHKSKKRTITGCVTSGANGMRLTDDKDKRTYALSGETSGVKPGDRMTLEGKRKGAGNTLVFEAQGVTRDFGPCQP